MQKSLLPKNIQKYQVYAAPTTYRKQHLSKAYSLHAQQWKSRPDLVGWALGVIYGWHPPQR